LLSLQELRTEHPLFPGRLFSNPIVLAGFAFSFCNALCMLGAIFLLPLYFQLLRGATAASSGVLLMPFLLAFVAVSYAGGRLARWIGRTRRLIVGSFAINALGFILLADVGPRTNIFLVMAAIFLAGGGVGMAMPCVSVSTQNAAERRDLGVASGGVLLFRMIGGAVGATLTGALLTAHLDDSPSRAGTAALTGGFHLAFLACAGFAVLGLLLASLSQDSILRAAGASGD
jgi:MFS family permease